MNNRELYKTIVRSVLERYIRQSADGKLEVFYFGDVLHAAGNKYWSQEHPETSIFNDAHVVDEVLREFDEKLEIYPGWFGGYRARQRGIEGAQG